MKSNDSDVPYQKIHFHNVLYNRARETQRNNSTTVCRNTLPPMAAIDPAVALHPNFKENEPWPHQQRALLS